MAIWAKEVCDGRLAEREKTWREFYLQGCRRRDLDLQDFASDGARLGRRCGGRSYREREIVFRAATVVISGWYILCGGPP